MPVLSLLPTALIFVSSSVAFEDPPGFLFFGGAAVMSDHKLRSEEISTVQRQADASWDSPLCDNPS